MATPHEPRLARVAAMVADPARSRMLSHLLSGDFATAGELAKAASVTAATASGHLAKLVDARFVICEPRGRHRYFRLGVQLFESLLAGDGLQAAAEGYALTDRGRAWLAGLGLVPTAPSGRRRYAYACMDWSERRDHLAGQLADELFRHCVEKGWLRRGNGREVELTPVGHRQLLPQLAPASHL